MNYFLWISEFEVGSTWDRPIHKAHTALPHSMSKYGSGISMECTDPSNQFDLLSEVFPTQL